VWVDVKEYMPEAGNRVITFSPVYSEDHPMRYRIMDAQFVRICPEVTHWDTLTPPEDSA
jgi:hypothetical protein